MCWDICCLGLKLRTTLVVLCVLHLYLQYSSVVNLRMERGRW